MNLMNSLQFIKILAFKVFPIASCLHVHEADIICQNFPNPNSSKFSTVKILSYMVFYVYSLHYVV